MPLLMAEQLWLYRLDVGWVRRRLAWLACRVCLLLRRRTNHACGWLLMCFPLLFLMLLPVVLLLQLLVVVLPVLLLCHPVGMLQLLARGCV